MLKIPCDELMGMHPHEAGKVIQHLIVMRDSALLQSTLEGSHTSLIREALIQSQDLPLLPHPWQLPHL